MKQPHHENRRPILPGGHSGPGESRTAVTVIGGVPWSAAAGGSREGDAPPSDSAEAVASLPNVTVRATARDDRPRRDRVSHARSPADDVGARGWLERAIAAWGEWLLRQSPAWTTSLSVHCAILMLLALWVVRERHAERLRLSLGFAGPASVAADAGADVVVAPDVKSPPEEENEIAKADMQPVDSPRASPAEVPEDAPEEAPGPESVAAAAPAVGMLLVGRDAGRREALVRAGGGSDATEAAVTLALEWLVRQVRKDGLWSMKGPYDDGGSQENRVAASAMALLAFQGAGNTLAEGPHRQVVARAWRAMLDKQSQDGTFDLGDLPMQHRHYSHAQATIALCEIYGMTRDERLAEPARRAVTYAIDAQGADGAWRYEPGQKGDMSVTGWYMMALKSAEMAGIEVPPGVFAGLAGFLDTVAIEKGRRYGYMRHSEQKPASPVTAAVSAEGLLCRQYLGWPRGDERLAAGLELLVEENPLDFQNAKDVYAWYYITQVAHHMEGEPWRRWNDQLRDVLPREQVLKGKERGSWDPSLDKWGHVGGRLFVTCFCTYMLEVYYRHLPLYSGLPGVAP
jgi:hypothetical protein